jgi:hypothetical protein
VLSPSRSTGGVTTSSGHGGATMLPAINPLLLTTPPSHLQSLSADGTRMSIAQKMTVAHSGNHSPSGGSGSQGSGNGNGNGNNGSGNDAAIAAAMMAAASEPMHAPPSPSHSRSLIPHHAASLIRPI